MNRQTSRHQKMIEWKPGVWVSPAESQRRARAARRAIDLLPADQRPRTYWCESLGRTVTIPSR